MQVKSNLDKSGSSPNQIEAFVLIVSQRDYVRKFFNYF